MSIAFVALTGEEAVHAPGLERLQQAVLSTAESAAAVRLFTDNAALSLPGVQVVQVAPHRNWWQRLTIERNWHSLLRQHGVTTLVFWGMASFFRSALPQALVLTAADFNQKKVPRLRKAAFAPLQLFVANEAARANLHQLLGEQRRVSVLRGQLPAPALLEADLQVVKDRFTQGAEFFLYQGPLHDTPSAIHLLKAFSRFKHRQKSGWKLVLLPEGQESVQQLQELLGTYKYREDVVLATDLGPEEVDSVYAAAWCFVFPATPAYWGTPLMRAIRWQLPLIGTEACREWAGNSGVYAEAGDEVRLSEHLMALYKDEGLHGRLRAAAAAMAGSMGWQPLLTWMEEQQQSR